MTGRPFHTRVQEWAVACFGATTAKDVKERNYRFLEESLELVQSLELTRESAHSMVDFVYDRAAGNPRQEVGGVMTTLGALCAAHEIDLMREAEAELARMWRNIEKIRVRNMEKPHG